MIFNILLRFIFISALANAQKNRSDVLLNFYGPDTNGSCYEKGESDSCFNRNINNNTYKVLEDKLDILKSEVNFMQLWNNFPKILVPTNSEDPICKKDSAEFLAGLNRTELWALKSKQKNVIML